MKLKWLAALALVGSAGLIAGCGGSDSPAAGTGTSAQAGSKITVYSGREEEIVAPLFVKFTKATGIEVDVRYGQSAELAAQIAEEGDNSPADVFFAQDAGALGAVAGQFAPLEQSSLDRVKPQFRAADGTWIGVSGRVRVVAYNTKKYTADDLPDTVAAYTDPKFKGRVGVAPTNASFQAFVTAMRLSQGEDAAKKFLTDLKANDPKIYPNNRVIVDAVAAGEVDLGLVNHYYLALVKAETPDAPVANKFLTPGDPGAFVNIAGVGVLKTSEHLAQANAFVAYLLSDEGQRFYPEEAEENEYPLVAGIPPQAGLPDLDSLAAKAVALSDLGAEERKTLDLINEVGLSS